MPCLNEKLPIDYFILRKIFIEELKNIINNELEYVDVIKNEKKERIKNNIINDFKNRINTNCIIERVIHKDYCIHRYNRGKNEGNICCKRVTNKGDRNKYVCRIHNKNHIPKKKILNEPVNKRMINTSINNTVKLLTNVNEIKEEKINKFYIKNKINSINKKNYNKNKILKIYEYKLKNNINIDLSLYIKYYGKNIL